MKLFDLLQEADDNIMGERDEATDDKIIGDRDEAPSDSLADKYTASLASI